MNAFVTGSRAYGTPREDSDIDLCVVVGELDYHTLVQWTEDGDTSVGNHSLRFGRLNVIVLPPDDFEAWKEATDELIAMKPVTKQKAIEVIEAAKARRKKAAA
jgi:predicted nucleotidyltransferase